MWRWCSRYTCAGWPCPVCAAPLIAADKAPPNTKRRQCRMTDVGLRYDRR